VPAALPPNKDQSRWCPSDIRTPKKRKKKNPPAVEHKQEEEEGGRRRKKEEEGGERKEEGGEEVKDFINRGKENRDGVDTVFFFFALGGE
jgi:hypothetical protein